MAGGGGGGRRRPKTRASRARGKKAKKTKYLSLSDVIIKVEAPPPPPEDEPAPKQQWEDAEVKQEEEGGGDGPDVGAAQQQQQMEPFALHHEASTLFEALPAPSLSDILGGGASSGGGAGDDAGSPSPSPSPSPSASASPEGFPGGAEEEDLALARRALRGRERWVYCSRSGSSPAATAATATTTSSSSPCSSAASTGASARSLLLKLDYEDILAAWADRAPLYIGGGVGGADAPEPQEIDAVLVEVEPPERAAAAWGATEAAAAPPAWPGRAERVRRYKEKRRNRLFAKRIRYEVRRVNAVKRPRFKGRFIREHEESELQPT